MHLCSFFACKTQYRWTDFVHKALCPDHILISLPLPEHLFEVKKVVYTRLPDVITKEEHND